MTAPTPRNNSSIGASGSAVTLPQPLVGSVIVIWAFAFSQITTPPTDSAGNTYTAQKQAQDANGNWINLFTAPVTAAGSGTLTINGSGAMCAIEVAGPASGTFIDGVVQSGTYSGSAGGLVSAAAITASFATDLILSAAFEQNGVTLVANTGTLVTSGTNSSDFAIIQAHTTSSTGSFTESFTVPASASETAVIIAIAIKGTGGGGGAALASAATETATATGTLGLKHIVADLVLETTLTTGTIPFALAGAVAGFRAFSSAMSDQDTCLYLAQAVTAGVPNGPWEIGIGTFNASGDTLTRTKVLRSSSSNAAVTFPAGTTTVALTEPAEALWNKGVFNAGNGGSAITIDWSNGPYQMLTLTAACTITFANSMMCPHGVLEIYQDPTGGRVPTITGAVYRSGSAPTWSTTSATHDTLDVHYNAVTGASNVFLKT